MSSAVVESRTSYLLDKLHSLSGVVLIGAYLVEHFFENSYALVSPDKYNYIAAKLETVPCESILSMRLPPESAIHIVPELSVSPPAG